MSSESVQPGIEPRTLRAATEYMYVEEVANALFEVTSQSGKAYTVDLREPACTCKDFEFRDGVEECKHIRRVRIEVGQVDIKKLESELTETADNLESNAADLQAQAQELTGTADELRDALDRIEEVSGQ